MTGYKRLIIGDGNVVRFWQAAQISRKELLGVRLHHVSCMDTLDSSLGEITDEFDYVLVSVLTSLVLDEVSSSDIRKSGTNLFGDVTRRIAAAAKKSSRAQVCALSYCFLWL